MGNGHSIAPDATAPPRGHGRAAPTNTWGDIPAVRTPGAAARAGSDAQDPRSLAPPPATLATPPPPQAEQNQPSPLEAVHAELVAASNNPPTQAYQPPASAAQARTTAPPALPAAFPHPAEPPQPQPQPQPPANHHHHHHHNHQAEPGMENMWVLSESERRGNRAVWDEYEIHGGKGRGGAETKEELGRGHYGVVRRCVRKSDGGLVAIKTVTKRREMYVALLRNEVAILRALEHPNIVRILDAFEEPRYLHLVFELCEGGELFEPISDTTYRFTERQASRIVRRMLLALRYVNAKGVIHRDLKPENVLLARGYGVEADVKVIDFGLATHLRPGEILTRHVGTPYYIAPEVLAKAYGVECDRWSLGVITFALLCGYPPFWGDTERDIYERVKRGVYAFEGSEWASRSEWAKDFIRGLLDMRPSSRTTVEQAIAHPWIVFEGPPPPLHLTRASASASASASQPEAAAAVRYFIRRLKALAVCHPLKRVALLCVAARLLRDKKEKDAAVLAGELGQLSRRGGGGRGGCGGLMWFSPRSMFRGPSGKEGSKSQPENTFPTPRYEGDFGADLAAADYAAATLDAILAEIVQLRSPRFDPAAALQPQHGGNAARKGGAARAGHAAATTTTTTTNAAAVTAAAPPVVRVCPLQLLAWIEARASSVVTEYEICRIVEQLAVRELTPAAARAAISGRPVPVRDGQAVVQPPRALITPLHIAALVLPRLSLLQPSALLRTFDELDADGDAWISPRDLVLTFRRLFGEEQEQQQEQHDHHHHRSRDAGPAPQQVATTENAVVNKDGDEGDDDEKWPAWYVGFSHVDAVACPGIGLSEFLSIITSGEDEPI